VIDVPGRIPIRRTRNTSYIFNNKNKTPSQDPKKTNKKQIKNK